MNNITTTINSKQNKVNHEGQENQISIPASKETNQLNLFDCARDSFPINSIRTYFDLSIIHRSLNRNHRISLINCRNLFKNDFTLDINEKCIK